MKRTKRYFAIVMTLALAFSMLIASSAISFAATQTKPLSPADADNATITINNPAKGETYSVFKLFDATVGEKGEISYQCVGEIPEVLSAFFTKDAQNNVIPDDSILEYDTSEPPKVIGSKMTDELKAALETWAGSADALIFAESDGSEALAFTGLPYGYYVVTTTHKPDGEDAKAAITVTSTKPNASINDKNSNEPSAEKKVDKVSYSIGDTITYTASFDTTNYMGEGADAKQVVDYIISDTLPPYLSDVEVTSFKIGGVDYTVDGEIPQFDANKTITIPWATKDTNVDPAKFTSLYNQGVKIEMVYTAVLTSTTNINDVDTNTISILPEVDNDQGDKEPWDEPWEDSAEITTYAAAIHKVDQDGEDLDGAQFTIAGLTVEEVSEGVYRVVSYDPEDTTASAVMDTDADGYLYILGLGKDVSLTVTEYKAPDGYNKMTGTKTLTPQVLSTSLYEASGTRYYDADGNLVKEESSGTAKTVTRNLDELNPDALVIQNDKGVVLPDTGGIGTVIFYVLGSILVIGSGIVLISRRRMDSR